MSFFLQLQNDGRVPSNKDFFLWKINLQEADVQQLTTKLQYAQPFQIDPRDAALYYSLWWKNNYNGGAPSRNEIFKSIGGNSRYNYNSSQFYTLAKQGAQMLGIKWIKKQNTLYFRTLLLQGGLPLKHITENQGAYQNFLMAVLEEQPETIEDFIFKPEIIAHLPSSSQNEIIYESCLKIVKSILKDETEYDALFKSNEALVDISTKLKIKKQGLKKKDRVSKPQNYWLLNFKEELPTVQLRIGFAPTYTVASLSNIFGFEVEGKEYQFYLNDTLLCGFYRMINGSYRTEWYQQQDQHWSGDSNLPYAYVIENGQKMEVKDFIQIMPNLYEPSLWTKYSDSEWRLIKGSGAAEKEAAILFPKEWSCSHPAFDTFILGQNLLWAEFAGEIKVSLKDDIRIYRSDVKSFEWTIISNKPRWMSKSSMPVIQNSLQLRVFDENNHILPSSSYRVWLKPRQSYATWRDLREVSAIPLGCLDLKIEKNEQLSYDTIFNIGCFEVDFPLKTIHRVHIKVSANSGFIFRLDESPILKIQNNTDVFDLEVSTEYSKIPTGVKGSLGLATQKKLYFEMHSPFEGMAIIDEQGQIVNQQLSLSLKNLYGLRILSTPKKQMNVCLRNKLKGDVKIFKEISDSYYPVMAFKEDILRLYYLQDAMDYRNKVILELKEGRETISYEIGLFSHTLDVTEQNENGIKLFDSDDQLELFAVPLNCTAEEIGMIPVSSENSSYVIPNSDFTNQFIVISPLQNGDQVMPRFVNTASDYIADNKETRTGHYHRQLTEESLEQESWQILLKYFNICVDNEIPFSTFDQITAISQSSRVAARAFFFLGINQSDPDEFIQKVIPKIERDLGFCFHWIKKEDWSNALNEVSEIYDNYNIFFGLLTDYLRENELFEISGYFTDKLPNSGFITNATLQEVRQFLGDKVLNELPPESPFVVDHYHLPIKQHPQIHLLLTAPIAVAESIADLQHNYPIWGGNGKRETIRRNIQYAHYLDRQYLNSNFYKKVIIQTLTSNTRS